jgi:hypothetical protein
MQKEILHLRVKAAKTVEYPNKVFDFLRLKVFGNYGVCWEIYLDS